MAANTTTRSGYAQPALAGGLVMGVLSALPLISALNACCCLWVVSGGLVAAYVYLLLSKRNPKSVPRLLFFFSFIPVLYLLLMLYKTDWFVDQKVPETLRSEQYVKETKSKVFELSSWFR